LLRLFVLALVMDAIAPIASASNVQEVRFVQSAKVLVWQDGELAGQGSEVALLNETPFADQAWIGAGQLEPALASADTFSGSVTLQIASNSGFVLETAYPCAAANIRVQPIGENENAQLRSIPVAFGSNVLFQQEEKTAIRAGTAQSQTISLQVSWTGPTSPALQVRTTGW